MPSICFSYADLFFLHRDCKQLRYVWLDKQTQMSFRCNQEPPTDLTGSCSTTRRLNVDSELQQTALIGDTWLLINATFCSRFKSPVLWSKSLTVLAAPPHAVPTLHQPVADDVKY